MAEAFTKGGKPGPGRPPGLANKSTSIAREAIARLVDTTAPLMQEWLDRIAEEHGPLVAWRCVNDVMEYHLPKLARTEHTGKDGEALTVKLDTGDGKLL